MGNQLSHNLTTHSNSPGSPCARGLLSGAGRLHALSSSPHHDTQGATLDALRDMEGATLDALDMLGARIEASQCDLDEAAGLLKDVKSTNLGHCLRRACHFGQPQYVCTAADRRPSRHRPAGYRRRHASLHGLQIRPRQMHAAAATLPPEPPSTSQPLMASRLSTPPANTATANAPSY